MSLSCRLSFTLLGVTLTPVPSSMRLAGQQHDPPKGTIELPCARSLWTSDTDPFVTTNRQLNEALTRLNIANSIEVYDADHGNRVGE